MASSTNSGGDVFTGNMEDRFNPESLKCVLCFDDLSEKRGLAEFPCCNNIFMCLCCLMELVVVNNTTIAPCCRRSLTFVRSPGSATRMEIERRRREAEIQLAETQHRQLLAQQNLEDIQWQNQQFTREQESITLEIANLRSTQAKLEKDANIALQLRKQKEQAEIIILQLRKQQEQEELKVLSTWKQKEQKELMVQEQRKQAAIQKEKELQEGTARYFEKQMLQRDTERKIKEYISSINHPRKLKHQDSTQIYQNLRKVLTKHPGMEEFILTEFAEFRAIDKINALIADDLKTNTNEGIFTDDVLQSLVKLQIMSLNGIDYRDPMLDTYFRNNLSSFRRHQVSPSTMDRAIVSSRKPIKLVLQSIPFIVSYNPKIGFSVNQKHLVCSDAAGHAITTNVEHDAKLLNLFALFEVVDCGTIKLTRQTCLAALTFDDTAREIWIHLLEFDVSELFGVEEAYIRKVMATPITPEIEKLIESQAQFKITKFSFEKRGRDLLYPTNQSLKYNLKFY